MKQLTMNECKAMKVYCTMTILPWEDSPITVTPEMVSKATTLSKAVKQAEAACKLDPEVFGKNVYSDEMEPGLLEIVVRKDWNSKKLTRYIPVAFKG